MKLTDPTRTAAQTLYNREVSPDAISRTAPQADAFAFCMPTRQEDDHMDTVEPDTIAISHTSLSTYQTCPKQYHAKYITKEVKFQQTEHTIYGNRMHEAMEHRLRSKTPLPEEFAALEDTALAVEQMKGHLMVEMELAVTRDLEPTQFFAKDVWLRGKADVIVFNPETGLLCIFDWKTGKPKKETQQLKIMALAAFYSLKGVKKIRVAFVYTKTGDVDREEFTVEQIPDIAGELRHETNRLEVAHGKNLFPPQPNGLCRQWCQVTSCQFHGRGAAR